MSTKSREYWLALATLYKLARISRLNEEQVKR
jgi:hypothetical protein